MLRFISHECEAGRLEFTFRIETAVPHYPTVLVLLGISQCLEVILQHHHIVGRFDTPRTGSVDCGDRVHMVDGEKSRAYIEVSETEWMSTSRRGLVIPTRTMSPYF